ncbi:MAG: hypothetical protein CVU16_06075 [Betaproteobacteria bacterium HGW-Betaproteobacteria-10]|nr:MAG: hypothetical protein CVU16_06075 [Betaproteobacteria bacterium HGW-Betaproteobacteria-10]
MTSHSVRPYSSAAVNGNFGPKFVTGLSLIELMVAVVIGLISVIVMMQMFAVSEGQKRTTVSGDNALTSGVISLNTLQREIRQSGWGLSAVSVIGCNLTGLTAWSTTAPVRLVPVTINPAGISGDTNTDTLMIVTGNGNGTVEGALIDSPSGGGYAIQGAESFAVGERVFASPSARPTSCDLSLTTVTSVARPNVNVAASVAGMQGGRLYSMGMAPSVRVYAIRGGNLAVCDYVASDCSNDVDWALMAENVVSMRAVYGRDTNPLQMDAGVDAWDQVIPTPATPVSTNPAKNTEACGLLRISAAQIVLVARSTQPEKTLDWPALTQHVTTQQPSWVRSGVAPIAVPSLPDTWPTWQDFRYKIFETVVPLRNITSAGVESEC